MAACIRTVAMWICALDAGAEGEAQLSYPAKLSSTGVDDLIEWLEFVTATLKARRERSAGGSTRTDPGVSQEKADG